MSDVPTLSVVVPVFNEQDNVASLLAEIVAALRGSAALQAGGFDIGAFETGGFETGGFESGGFETGGFDTGGFDTGDFEIVFVDDQSLDDTHAVLQRLKARTPELRVLRHAAQSGQSTALRNGIKAARGAWIATLDGDGQNDPADIPRLIAARDAASVDTKLIAGWRVDRQDSGSKRWASKWANAIRQRMLRDDTPDTGCGIKLFEREAFLDLPYFDHMHRYLPALMQRAGWKTTSVAVNHRPRASGVSKYSNFNRALIGLSDLGGVSWLLRRSKRTEVDEL